MASLDLNQLISSVIARASNSRMSESFQILWYDLQIIDSFVTISMSFSTPQGIHLSQNISYHLGQFGLTAAQAASLEGLDLNMCE